MNKNEMIKSDLQNDSVLNSEVSDFDIAGMESYYQRNVLNIGRGVLDLTGVTVQE